MDQKQAKTREFNNIFYDLCHRSTIYPYPLDLSSCSFADTLSSEIEKDINNIESTKLYQMQQIFAAYLQTIHTYDENMLQEINDYLQSERNASNLAYTKQWIKSIVAKYPSCIACIILYIVTPWMTKDIFLCTDTENTIKIPILNQSRKIITAIVPAWELPATIYNHLMVFVGLNDKYFKPILPYHQPKALQCAFLSAIQFSVYIYLHFNLIEFSVVWRFFYYLVS